jgi:hypothetical protein
MNSTEAQKYLHWDDINESQNNGLQHNKQLLMLL